MTVVSLRQISDHVTRSLRAEAVARAELERATATTQTTPEPVPAALSGKVKLKLFLKRIPLVAPLLVVVFRIIMLPARITYLVQRIEMLTHLLSHVQRIEARSEDFARALGELKTQSNLSLQLVTGVHQKNDTMFGNVARLNEKSDSSSRALTELYATSNMLAQLITGVHQKNDAMFNHVTGLNEKSDSTSRTLADLHGKSDLMLQLITGVHQKNDALKALQERTQSDGSPVLHAGDNLVIGKVDGFIMAFPAEEWRLPAHHLLRGMLEPGLMAVMRDTIKEGMTVVDVGANVGTHTLLALRAIGNSGKVISYEPTPRTFAVLKDNVQINGFLETGRIDLRRKAVSDGAQATSAFFVMKNALTHNSLYAAPGMERIDVDTVSLDADLGPKHKVDVIKIDAEGAEPAIFRGMKKLIAQNPEIVIFCEFSPDHFARAKEDMLPHLDEMRAAGFTVMNVEEPRGTLSAISNDALTKCFSVNLMLRKAK